MSVLIRNLMLLSALAAVACGSTTTSHPPITAPTPPTTSTPPTSYPPVTVPEASNGPNGTTPSGPVEGSTSRA